MSAVRSGLIQTRDADGSAEGANAERPPLLSSFTDSDSVMAETLDAEGTPLANDLASPASEVDLQAYKINSKPQDLRNDMEDESMLPQTQFSIQDDQNSHRAFQCDEDDDTYSFATMGHLLYKADTSADVDLSSRPSLSDEHYSCLHDILTKKIGIWPRLGQELYIYSNEWKDEEVKARVSREMKQIETARSWTLSFFPALPPAERLTNNFLSLQAAFEYGNPDRPKLYRSAIGTPLVNRNRSGKVGLFVVTCAHLFDPDWNDESVESVCEQQQRVDKIVMDITRGQGYFFINDFNNSLSASVKGIVKVGPPIIPKFIHSDRFPHFTMDALLAKIELQTTSDSLKTMDSIISFKDTIWNKGNDLKVHGIWKIANKSDIDNLLKSEYPVYVGVGNTLIAGKITNGPSSQYSGHETMITAAFTTPLCQGQSGSMVYLALKPGYLCVLGIVCNRQTFSKELREIHEHELQHAELIKIMPIFPFLHMLRSETRSEFTQAFKTVHQYCAEMLYKTEHPERQDSGFNSNTTHSSSA